MIKLYGIPNCDTIKKTRKWLNDNAVDYKFHDYKKLGVPEKQLKKWIKQLDWESLLNKRGTTWRKLDDDIKDNINQDLAITVMIENPSIIKRPLLDIDGKYSVGFSEDNYRKLFL